MKNLHWLAFINIGLYFVITDRVDLFAEAAPHPSYGEWNTGTLPHCSHDHITKQLIRSCQYSKRNSIYNIPPFTKSDVKSYKSYQSRDDTDTDHDTETIIGLAPYKSQRVHPSGWPSIHSTSDNNYNHNTRRGHEYYYAADNPFHHKSSASVENVKYRQVRDAAKVLINKCCSEPGCKDSDFKAYCTSSYESNYS